jgi:lysophospholipase L1-like esterase
MDFRRLGIAAVAIVGLSLTACTHPSPPEATPTAGSFLVVALGDSYASGQGAPNDQKWFRFCTSPWNDQRCNRSKWAPTTQAVERLRARGYDIVYRSFACSGASITEGLIGPYRGQQPRPGDPLLEPQLNELAALAQNPGDVDAVTISAGGNDALFGPIVATCMLPPSDCDIINPFVEEALVTLSENLDTLAVQIEGEIEIEPHRILLVGYADPTRRSDGSFCDREPDADPLAGIDAEEARWAAEYVLPKLNRRLCLAALQRGWSYVAAPEEFETRGWCSDPDDFRENWINTGFQSLAKQNTPFGMMHPTRDGHHAVSERLESRIQTLLDAGTPVSDLCPDEPPPWP